MQTAGPSATVPCCTRPQYCWPGDIFRTPTELYRCNQPRSLVCATGRSAFLVQRHSWNVLGGESDARRSAEPWSRRQSWVGTGRLPPDEPSATGTLLDVESVSRQFERGDRLVDRPEWGFIDDIRKQRGCEGEFRIGDEPNRCLDDGASPLVFVFHSYPVGLARSVAVATRRLSLDSPILKRKKPRSPSSSDA